MPPPQIQWTLGYWRWISMVEEYYVRRRRRDRGNVFVLIDRRSEWKREK
jgi:hypothetical protein